MHAVSATERSSQESKKEEKKADADDVARSHNIDEERRNDHTETLANVTHVNSKEVTSAKRSIRQVDDHVQKGEAPAKKTKIDSCVSSHESVSSRKIDVSEGDETKDCHGKVDMGPATSTSQEQSTRPDCPVKKGDEQDARGKGGADRSSEDLSFSGEHAQPSSTSSDIRAGLEDREEKIEKTTFPLNVIHDLATLTDSSAASCRSIAFPLLCCCPLLKCEPLLAAR